MQSILVLHLIKNQMMKHHFRLIYIMIQFLEKCTSTINATLCKNNSSGLFNFNDFPPILIQNTLKELKI